MISVYTVKQMIVMTIINDLLLLGRLLFLNIKNDNKCNRGSDDNGDGNSNGNYRCSKTGISNDEKNMIVIITITATMMIMTLMKFTIMIMVVIKNNDNNNL